MGVCVIRPWLSKICVSVNGKMTWVDNASLTSVKTVHLFRPQLWKLDVRKCSSIWYTFILPLSCFQWIIFNLLWFWLFSNVLVCIKKKCDFSRKRKPRLFKRYRMKYKVYLYCIYTVQLLQIKWLNTKGSSDCNIYNHSTHMQDNFVNFSFSWVLSIWGEFIRTYICVCI